MESTPLRWSRVVYALIALTFTICLVFGGGWGIAFACNAYNRYQSRENANNRVSINNIKIRYYDQQEKIAQKQADIRYIHATGIRRAQDEIAKTLTPMYIQWEAIQAQLTNPGKTIYIPSGANGVPLVSTIPLQKAAK